MVPEHVKTRAFPDQKPGTSGLRKKTRVFMQPGYLENFIQSVFVAIGGLHGKSLVLGGDGRFFCPEACQTILRMAVANGVERVIVGRDGLLSTPAASCLIRQRGADGGIILSASHNPGGPEGDFGVKYNIANGGPAPESVTRLIHGHSTRITEFRTMNTGGDLDLGRTGEVRLGSAIVEITDPVEEYAGLMERLFDFDAIHGLFTSGFRMRFDAMNAITGPYARAILEERIGAEAGTVIRAEPLPDFGGLHPDPNPIHAAELFKHLMGGNAPDLGAVADGDGDRNMIVGKGCYVSPSDNLAVLAANASLAPGYSGGLKGIARSMPTSRAADRVALRLRIPAHETPTGWKFFGSLLDAGQVTICGEESFGAGSDHIREKDGLWAVLLWLNILARRRCSVGEILRDHWKEHGRDYFSRHDYEGLDSDVATGLMDRLRERLTGLSGKEAGGRVVKAADDFAYVDPVDDTVTEGQGVRIWFQDGGRGVLRLSGTGTEGATLRVYLEQPEPSRHDLEPQSALSGIAAAVDSLAGIRESTGRTGPDIRT